MYCKATRMEIKIQKYLIFFNRVHQGQEDTMVRIFFKALSLIKVLNTLVLCSIQMIMVSMIGSSYTERSKKGSLLSAIGGYPLAVG
jgi:hypothetical protein